MDNKKKHAFPSEKKIAFICICMATIFFLIIGLVFTVFKNFFETGTMQNALTFSAGIFAPSNAPEKITVNSIPIPSDDKILSWQITPDGKAIWCMVESETERNKIYTMLLNLDTGSYVLETKLNINSNQKHRLIVSPEHKYLPLGNSTKNTFDFFGRHTLAIAYRDGGLNAAIAAASKDEINALQAYSDEGKLKILARSASGDFIPSQALVLSPAGISHQTVYQQKNPDPVCIQLLNLETGLIDKVFMDPNHLLPRNNSNLPTNDTPIKFSPDGHYLLAHRGGLEVFDCIKEQLILYNPDKNDNIKRSVVWISNTAYLSIIWPADMASGNNSATPINCTVILSEISPDGKIVQTDKANLASYIANLYKSKHFPLETTSIMSNHAGELTIISPKENKEQTVAIYHVQKDEKLSSIDANKQETFLSANFLINSRNLFTVSTEKSTSFVGGDDIKFRLHNIDDGKIIYNGVFENKDKNSNWETIASALLRITPNGDKIIGYDSISKKFYIFNLHQATKD